MRVLSGHRAPVRCLAYSPDGRILASGSEDNTARLWDLTTGAQRAVLRGHRGYVRALAFSPDGETLASAADYPDTVVRLWDPARGLEKAAVDTRLVEVACVVFTPDGGGVVVAGWERWWEGRVLTVRLADLHQVGLHRGPGRRLAASPGGNVFAGATHENTIHVWGDRRAGPLAGHRQEVRALAFSPDGMTLLSAAAGELKRWYVPAGEELRAGPPSTGPGLPLGFSADTALLATGEDGLVRVSDTRTGREVAAFDWGFGPVYAAAFAPDGMTAAAAGRDFRVVVWDLEE